MRIPLVLLFLFAPAVSHAGGGLEPARAYLETVIDLPSDSDFYSTDLDWAGADSLVLATSRGLEILDLESTKLSTLVPAVSLPEGVRNPNGVACDGENVLTFSLPNQSLSAWRLKDGKRLLALRKPPGFMIMDVALWGDQMALLGFPRDASGRMDNPSGVAVWAGPLAPDWQKLWPLHMLKGGDLVQRHFEMALWPLCGALARTPGGLLCAVTPVESGVSCYGPDGRLQGVVGLELDELVGQDLDRAFSSLGGNAPERYRQVVNRQLWIDGLVVTPEGLAVVVRRAESGVVRWELWFPGPRHLLRRVLLPLEVDNPMAHLHGEARGRRLAAVVKMTTPSSPSLQWRVVIFRLPEGDNKEAEGQ